jgi:anti-anti-sigma regulatory factor
MEIITSLVQARVPVTVFHIKGDIDANTSEQLEQETQQAIKSGTKDLLIDMSDVPYISSYGVRSLSQIFYWLRDAATEGDNALSQGLRDGKFKSHHMKLACPSERVSNVLSLAGIDMFIDIHKDVKQALAAF